MFLTFFCFLLVVNINCAVLPSSFTHKSDSSDAIDLKEGETDFKQKEVDFENTTQSISDLRNVSSHGLNVTTDRNVSEPLNSNLNISINPLGSVNFTIPTEDKTMKHKEQQKNMDSSFKHLVNETSDISNSISEVNQSSLTTQNHSSNSTENYEPLNSIPVLESKDSSSKSAAVDEITSESLSKSTAVDETIEITNESSSTSPAVDEPIPMTNENASENIPVSFNEKVNKTNAVSIDTLSLSPQEVENANLSQINNGSKLSLEVSENMDVNETLTTTEENISPLFIEPVTMENDTDNVGDNVTEKKTTTENLPIIAELKNTVKDSLKVEEEPTVKSDDNESFFSGSSFDFLLNSEVAKNAVQALEVFNFSDPITDHMIEENEIHGFLESSEISTIDADTPNITLPVSDSGAFSNEKLKMPGQMGLNNSSSGEQQADVNGNGTNDMKDAVSNGTNLPVELANVTSAGSNDGSQCPPPGFCVFWFWAQDACAEDSHCLGSRICCRVRCSKACIEV